MIPLLSDGPARGRITLALAHGAGAPMDSPFMNTVARSLGEGGVRVVRFEFPYMRLRRTEGKRGAPDRPAVLMRTWLEVIEHLGRERLIIGGKSMGGRIASMVADEAGVVGLVCLGYPFHPPGNPAKMRTAHLEHLKTRSLIVQGTRDTFGSKDDVAGYRLSPKIRVVWIVEGDHSFKPPARSGRTEKENLSEAIGAVRTFLARAS